MTESLRRTAIAVGLSGFLLVSGLLFALTQPPPVQKEQVKTESGLPGIVGYLVVSVILGGASDQPGQPLGGSSYLGPNYLPLPGVAIGVAEDVQHGIRFALQTNESGMTKFPLGPGQWVVTISDRRFKVATSVSISSGKVTRIDVNVTKHSYLPFFGEGLDPASNGLVNTWNSMTLAVGAYNFSGGVYRFEGGHFGQTVFLEFTQPSGTEIRANVLSQSISSGVSWLTVQPQQAIDLSHDVIGRVVTFIPAYKVSFPNG